jgi:cephalosporin-C deacetylase-like acetyl esterase
MQLFATLKLLCLQFLTRDINACTITPKGVNMTRKAETSDGAEEKRAKLRQLLGHIPRQEFKIFMREQIKSAPEMQVEKLLLQTTDGSFVRGFLTGPKTPWKALPALIYCHAHGNRYAMGANELIEGRPSLLPTPYGQELAQNDIVALSIDMPCFGERNSSSEAEMSKRLLYQGKTMMGQMLSELSCAFHLLGSLDGVDANRLGALGFSMGATHSFWLAALEPRIKVVAHACSFADLDHLVRSAAHDLHGLYMTVPNLLQHFSTGEIAGLIAPRPQLACIGLLDPLTPKPAVDIALMDLRAAYARLNAEHHLNALIDAHAGHRETKNMRRTIIEFFKCGL